MATRNRFQLGSALGGYVAGLQDAAELSLARATAQRTGQQAGVLAEERELLKGRRREFEATAGLRLASEKAKYAQQLATLRGTQLQSEALAYDLEQARRTQGITDAMKIANLDLVRSQAGAAKYELSEAQRTQNVRDAQKLANLQSTMAATQASEMATIQGAAEYREFIEGAKMRAAERRAVIAEANSREKFAARQKQAEVRNAELNREINEFKLRVLQDDQKLDKEIKDLSILLAKKDDEEAFARYKQATDDPYMQRYDSIEDPGARNYLNRKMYSLIMDPKTRRQQILNTAKAINSRSTVKQIQDQLLLDVFQKGPQSIMQDENKFWFMMFSRAGIPNDPLMPMMWDKMRGMAIGSDYSPTKELPAPPPETGEVLPTPPEKITAEELEVIEGTGQQRRYDSIYGVGSFEKAKERTEYKPERDEPLTLKEGPGFGMETLRRNVTIPGAYSFEDLQRDLAAVGRDFKTGDLIRIF